MPFSMLLARKWMQQTQLEFEFWSCFFLKNYEPISIPIPTRYVHLATDQAQRLLPSVICVETLYDRKHSFPIIYIVWLTKVKSIEIQMFLKTCFALMECSCLTFYSVNTSKIRKGKNDIHLSNLKKSWQTETIII